MGNVRSKVADKVTRFLPSIAQIKGYIIDSLRWCGHGIDELLGLSPRPSGNAVPPETDDSETRTPPPIRPTRQGPYRSGTVNFAFANDIPVFLEPEDHVDYILAQGPGRIHGPRPTGRENPASSCSPGLNIGGVGNQLNNGPSPLRFPSAPPANNDGAGPSTKQARAKQPPSTLREDTIEPAEPVEVAGAPESDPAEVETEAEPSRRARRDVPLPLGDFRRSVRTVHDDAGDVQAQSAQISRVDDDAEDSPSTETFVTAREGSSNDEESPVAESFVTAATESFVTAKEDSDNEGSDTDANDAVQKK